MKSRSVEKPAECSDAAFAKARAAFEDERRIREVAVAVEVPQKVVLGDVEESRTVGVIPVTAVAVDKRACQWHRLCLPDDVD